MPGTMEALTALPGVGRKTANVVLANAFGVPTIAVDTHVFRVSNRLGLANAKTVEETERQLMDVIPRRDWIAAHHWLIFHGRRQCHARKPACETCGIALECAYFNRPIPSVSAVQDADSLSEKAAAGSGHGRAKAGALRAADEPNGVGAPDSAAKKENARKVRGTGQSGGPANPETALQTRPASESGRTGQPKHGGPAGHAAKPEQTSETKNTTKLAKR